MRIICMERRTNEDVLEMVKEKRNDVQSNRRGRIIGHLIRHDIYIKIFHEGKIESRGEREEDQEFSQ